jgi:hypothetical protein
MGVGHLWEPLPMGMTFAADGQSGIILTQTDEHGTLVDVDLAGGEPRFEAVELESSPPLSVGAQFALSPSGAHVLLAHENGASLFAVPSGRRVATATVPPGWRPAAVRFIGESLGRVWLFPSIGRPASPVNAVRLLDIALEGEARTRTVSLAAPVDPFRAWPGLVLPDTSGQRFLTRDGGLRLRDGATGDLLAVLVDDPSGSPAPYSGGTLKGLFLADGRIVVGEAVEARTVLHVFDADGEPLHDVTLDRIPAGLGVGPEVAPGRVAIRFNHALTGPDTVVLDLAEGRIVETLRGQRPLGGFFWLDTPTQGPGGEASTAHFLVGPDNSVVRRDFANGEEKVVAGPQTPGLERLPGP